MVWRSRLSVRIALRGEATPLFAKANEGGVIAQLGERVLCKHEVVGSIPSGSTIQLVAGPAGGSAFISEMRSILAGCSLNAVHS